MTEIEALEAIAAALNRIAVSMGNIGVALWLMLLFKNMSGHHHER